MRIAGNTIRRNFLKNYERNASTKFDSEKRIETNRKFCRASENPIDAAKALRVRKALSELDTSTANLKSADSIYQSAESSMSKISELIQLTYEKLVEGAHGTRNLDDLEIIAKEVDEKAEEMIQLLNVDVADRKIFGGTNNTTVAFAIKGDNESGRYVTYNGVPVNASSDPYSFPSSEKSYLDIGIGMSIDNSTERIDDQTALPITFNGVECTGCGVTKRYVKINLDELRAGVSYKLNVSLGTKQKTITFLGGNTIDKSISNINEQLKEAFQSTPEVDAAGTFNYLKNVDGYTKPEVYSYANADITDNRVDVNAMSGDNFYSLEVSANGKTRVIDFKGDADPNVTADNIRKALKKKFGDEVDFSIATGFKDSAGNPVSIKNSDDYKNQAAITQDADSAKIDLANLTDGEEYTLNVNGTKVTFIAGATEADNIKNINDALSSPASFGKANVPQIKTNSGLIEYDSTTDVIYVENAKGGEELVEFEESGGYPNNIVQILLDSAKLLREGDQDMVARYADLLYDAQGSLSIAIAELGTHDQFIDFNLDRITDINLNMSDKQNDLEITDLPTEITNYKVLEAIYNATLQMGASIIPQSIFNYIK